MWKLSLVFATTFFSCAAIAAPENAPDAARDILVTFSNGAAESTSAGLGPPYKHRKRYTISRQVRRDATAVAAEYSLAEIDHWPIQSLAVYCFVYRVPEGADRQSIIASLNADARVESAQPLQIFEVSTERQDTFEQSYDDTYADLQYGLDILHIAAAHRTTRGAGVRVVMIDSSADSNHEDLRGQIKRIREFSGKGQTEDRNHGTAVASIIGARPNNSLGIVGVAPEATLEVYVSCWSAGAGNAAICDTFSLSKALDAVLDKPPNVLNLSLTGPYDPLLERLIQKVFAAGVVVVAAGSAGANLQNSFPSNMQQVIGVDATPTQSWTNGESSDTLFAPGDRILVALPTNRYDFRSGSSLAAAHASGVVALVLAIAPNSSFDAISSILLRSQSASAGSIMSINACVALYLTGSAQNCND